MNGLFLADESCVVIDIELAEGADGKSAEQSNQHR